MPGARPANPTRERISEERVIELVDSRRKDSLDYNRSVFGRLQGYYDAYRGHWLGKTAQFRNNITMPFIFAMIQSDVARKVQTSFGTWPIVQFEGYAPEDSARAKRNEVLISAQMKDADSVMKAVDFCLQADICGTGVARWGWKNITRRNRYRKLEQVGPGLRVPVMYEDNAEIFNGPDWDVVDRLDFWQQPGRKRIPDMDWVIHRYWLDWDNMMDDANSEYPYFDKSAVVRLQNFPLGSSAHDEWTQRRVSFRNEYDYAARIKERFAKPVEIWEMHGLVPSEFAIGGMRHLCVAIGNERVVLKYREGPMPNQTKPFGAYSPMSDPYSFDGPGKAEIAFGPQRTADRLNNQRLDAIDHIIDPQYVVANSANLNTQNLFSRAGRIILVDGDASENTFRAISPDMRGLQIGSDEIGRLFQMMQLGTGETEAIIGLAGQSRETARGFLGRQENALTRLSLESRLLEEGFVEPLANAFRLMDKLLMPLPHELKILGSLATTNPVTGLPYLPENIQVDYDDLAADYRARAVGTSQMMGRGVRQQNLLGLLQMMSTNPTLMQIVNWANFARQAFELFDFKNVNELLVQQVPAVNQLAAEAGTSPEQVANTVSQPLDRLSPQVLSQLFNAQAAT